MSRVIHFEIPADNPERASKFYSDVFGWKFQKWAGPMDYWLITTGDSGEPGINGGLLRRQQPGASTVNTVGVASVDKFLPVITKNGGKVVAPKMAIPGVGYAAYCQDPEGNVFGVFQDDPGAK
ncbi:MAG: VOC family protein [Acidobacteria bacterium]|nr:VOC family protein [Acidobacteriota bacterium]